MSAPQLDKNTFDQLWILSNQIEEATKGQEDNKVIKDVYIHTIVDPEGKNRLEVRNEGGNIFTRIANWCSRLVHRRNYLITTGEQAPKTPTAKKLQELQIACAKAGCDEAQLREAVRKYQPELTESKVVEKINKNFNLLNKILGQVEHEKEAKHKGISSLFDAIRMPLWETKPPAASEILTLLEKDEEEAKDAASKAAAINDSGKSTVEAFNSAEDYLLKALDAKERAEKNIQYLKELLGKSPSTQFRAQLRRADESLARIKKSLEQAFYNFIKVEARWNTAFKQAKSQPKPIVQEIRSPTWADRLDDASKRFATTLQQLEMCVLYKLLPAKFVAMKNMIEEASGRVKAAVDDTTKLQAVIKEFSPKFAAKDVQNVLRDVKECFPYLTSLDLAIKKCPKSESELQLQLKDFLIDFSIFIPPFILGTARIVLAYPKIRENQASKLENFLDRDSQKSLKTLLFKDPVAPAYREVAHFVRSLIQANSGPKGPI